MTTINGTIHAIEIDDTNEKLELLWSLDTERLISSSIDKLEVYFLMTCRLIYFYFLFACLKQLYRDDNSLMRIIPSLDGSLFAHYSTGDELNPSVASNIEKVPFNVEDLLKTSVKLSNRFTIIGGITTKTVGVDLTTGQVYFQIFFN